MDIAKSPFAQRISFFVDLIVSAHHKDRRLHPQRADAFEDVEPLSPENGIAYARHHHVQQDQIEALSLKDGERISNRTRCCDLICVRVPEGRHDVPRVYYVPPDASRIHLTQSLYRSAPQMRVGTFGGVPVLDASGSHDGGLKQHQAPDAQYVNVNRGSVYLLGTLATAEEESSTW
jgi:hypothetical protein